MEGWRKNGKEGGEERGGGEGGMKRGVNLRLLVPG